MGQMKQRTKKRGRSSAPSRTRESDYLYSKIREVHVRVEWDQEQGLMREAEGSALSSVSCDNIVVDVEV